MAKAIKKISKKGNKASLGFKRVMTLFFLLAFVLLFAPSALYFLICMIPTIVAVIVDKGTPRTLGITVGAMNFAGAIPKWLDILSHSSDMSYAVMLALQPSTLVLAYGAAGIGWILYFFVARFIAAMTQRKTEVRLKKVKKRQAMLIERWGNEIKKIN